MKKFISILLVIGMILSLAACGGSDNETSSESETTVEAQQTESTEEPTEETRENKVITDGNGKILRFGGAKVTVWLVGETKNQDGVNRVRKAISEYFLDNWNIEVDIRFQAESGYKEKIALMLTDAEDCDIFCSGLVGFTDAVNYGLCYDLYNDNMIQTYGSNIWKRVNYEYLDACESWGGLYGVPSFGKQAVGQWCIAMAATYLKQIGYDMSALSLTDVNAISYDELTALFGDLKSAFPSMYMLHPGDYETLFERILYDPLGGDDFGVLLDPQNSLEISDLFTSELFADYCSKMRYWETRGFIAPDAQSGDDTTEEIIAGTLMSDTVAGRPGIGEEVKELRAAMSDSETVVFQLGENFVHSGQVISRAWSIDSLCENPEAAMIVLNALFTDTEVINLILWGEMDLDYVVKDDGHVTFGKNKSINDYEYYDVVSVKDLPCMYDAYVKVGRNVDIGDALKDFNDTAPKSIAIGFLFEKYDEAVAAEYTALTNTVKENIDDLLFGKVNPETGIQELCEKLSAAGLGSYISAKQAQFTDWAARVGKQ